MRIILTILVIGTGFWAEYQRPRLVGAPPALDVIQPIPASLPGDGTPVVCKTVWEV